MIDTTPVSGVAGKCIGCKRAKLFMKNRVANPLAAGIYNWQPRVGLGDRSAGTMAKGRAGRSRDTLHRYKQADFSTRIDFF